jgi:hypothetical protein
MFTNLSFKTVITLWPVDPLLDNNRETNEITAIARQQRHKYAKVMELLLGSGPHATTEVLLGAVFSMGPLRGYITQPTELVLTEENHHFFTFYTKADRLVKVVIRHLPGNTSAEDITVVLQDTDYIISVKQVTTKHPTPKGWVVHTSLPLFLVTVARNQKVPIIFKLTTFCNIVIKIEAYKSQNEVT